MHCVLDCARRWWSFIIHRRQPSSRNVLSDAVPPVHVDCNRSCNLFAQEHQRESHVPSHTNRHTPHLAVHRVSASYRQVLITKMSFRTK